MSRRKANPSVKALEPYLERVKTWNAALDRGTPLRLIRSDMDKGELAHLHLTDDQLEAAVRAMRRLSAKLPRDPGVAADRLMKAMKL